MQNIRIPTFATIIQERQYCALLLPSLGLPASEKCSPQIVISKLHVTQFKPLIKKTISRKAMAFSLFLDKCHSTNWLEGINEKDGGMTR